MRKRRVAALVAVVIAPFGALALAAPAGWAASPAAAGYSGLSTFVPVGTSDYETLSVNVANGNLLVAADDGAADPGSGGAVPFVRYYNSEAQGDADRLSPGWSLSAGLDVNLAVQSDGSILYHGPSGNTATFTPQPNGSYTSSDTTASLTKSVAANGVATYLVTDPVGSVLTFDAQGTLTNTTPDWGDGAKSDVSYYPLQIDLPPALKEVQVEGSPEYLQLIRPKRVVTGLINNAGNTLSYGYDASSRLTSFTVGGATTTYGYNSAGLLDSVTEPDGTQASVSYNGANEVSSLEVTPAGGGSYGYQISYDAPTGVCAPSDVGQTTLTPYDTADDTTTVYCYNASGVVDVTSPGTAGFGDSEGDQTSPDYPLPDSVPPQSQTQAPSSAQSATASPSVFSFTFSNKQHRYNYTNNNGKACNFSASARTPKDFTHLAWGCRPSARFVSQIDPFDTITETAAEYDLITGKKIQTEATHNELPGYTFHGSVSNVGNGLPFELVIQLVAPLPPSPEAEGFHIAGLTFKFRLLG